MFTRPQMPMMGGMDRIAPPIPGKRPPGSGIIGRMPGQMMPSPTRPSNVGPIMPKPGIFGQIGRKFSDPTFLKALGSNLSTMRRPQEAPSFNTAPFQRQRFGAQPMMRRAQMDFGGY